MPIGNSLSIIKVEKPEPLDITNHIHAYRGENTNNIYSFFIKDNGNLYVAGKNNAWQQGRGGAGGAFPPDTTIITKVDGIDKTTSVSTGENTSLAQVRNINIYGAGSNAYKQFCGNAAPTSSKTFLEVGKNFQAKSIKSGIGYFLIWFKTNDFTAYGTTIINEVLGRSEDLNFNTTSFYETDVTLFDAGYNHIIFLKNNILKSIGRNTQGQLGNNTTTLSRSSVTMDTSNLAGKTIKDVGANKGGSIVLCSDNTVYICGNMLNTVFGKKLVQSNIFSVPMGVSMVKLSVGYDHILVLCSNGDVYSVGENDKGQLGDGSTTTNRTSLVKVNITKPVAEISAGIYYSLLYCTDGTYYGFGQYTYALGTIAGLTINQPITTPTQLIF